MIDLGKALDPPRGHVPPDPIDGQVPIVRPDDADDRPFVLANPVEFHRDGSNHLRPGSRGGDPQARIRDAALPRRDWVLAFPIAVGAQLALGGELGAEMSGEQIFGEPDDGQRVLELGENQRRRSQSHPGDSRSGLAADDIPKAEQLVPDAEEIA